MFRRIRRVARSLWLHGYDRGWDEAIGLAVENLEGLMRDADGTVVSKADVKALLVRLRREAEH
ncbi:MAG: hypothetical protein QOH84_5937 [Kribbellaceae bacterium]|nr:hypothetical protein [Kribbellaceae bacterium]